MGDLNKPSFNLSSYFKCLTAITNFVALFCTCSNFSIKIWRCGFHTLTAYSKWERTKALYNTIKLSEGEMKGNGKPLGHHLARNNKHDESFTMKDSINWLHFELLLWLATNYYKLLFGDILDIRYSYNNNSSLHVSSYSACDMNLYSCLGFYIAINLMTSVHKY